jgi:signal transduction histidine kinase
MIRRLQIPLWLESTAAIVLALIVSTVVTVVVFQREDQTRTAQFNIDNLFERIPDAVSAVERAPPELRPELLQAFSRLTRFLTLDSMPLVQASDTRDKTAETRISEMVPKALRGEVRVRRVSPEEAGRYSKDLPPPSASFSQANISVGPVSMLISINVGEAGWLNVRYMPPLQAPRYGPALISGMVAAIVMMLAAWWTYSRFAAPLQKLTEAATALRRGEPVPEIHEGGPPAVRNATRSFNAMSQRLTATLENQRSIMAAVAHDLRTPIASMRLRAEFVADEEQRTRLKETLDEMQTMTEAVLSAARADRTGETARPVDLTALVESLADDIKETGGDVVFSPSGAVRCICRTNEVRRAVRNLIENALRYGERARVGVAMERDFALVSVEDDGPGIPSSDIDRVFEPFVRLETSRSAQTGGYGLGLSITRWIARGHGGDVFLRNRNGGGLSAVVRLPLQG